MAQVTVSGVDGPDGLKALAADLDRAAAVAPAVARQVVQRGALNIKTDWRREWSGLSHAPALHRAVGYDTWVTASGAAAEIGPDTDKRQGYLGNVAEYGTVNNAPHPGGAPALERERPRFAKALEDVAADELERRR